MKKKKRFEHAECGDIEYFFGHEPHNLAHKHCLGLMLSCWGSDSLLTRRRLSYNFAKEAYGVLGRGYGGQNVAKNDGVNWFSNPNGRGSNQPHPTPGVADNEISQHQYFSDSLRNVLL